MLVIRLQRAGRKKSPFYRIVVAEKSAPVKGRYVERVGYYNPMSDPKEVVLEKEKIVTWIQKGAQPSETMARLLAKEGIKEAEKFVKARLQKPSKKELEAKQKAEEEAAAKKAAEEEAKAAAEAAAAEKESAEESPEAPAEKPEEGAKEEAVETPAEEAPAAEEEKKKEDA